MIKTLLAVAVLALGAMAFASTSSEPAAPACCKDCACKKDCCKDGKCTCKDCKACCKTCCK